MTAQQSALCQKLIMQGSQNSWEIVVGLEVHAQILTNSKLFSTSPTNFGANQNHNVSLIDAAMPGMLPVVNMQAIRQALKTSLALGCTINARSVFDRKNYFYPDLPQSYQISQFYLPIGENGSVKLYDFEKDVTQYHEIHIERLHIEQDAGKSFHDQLPHETLIDLNRSGIGLMEIVTKPDFNNIEQIVEYLKLLRNMLRYLDTSDGDMEKGSFRCDANVSVRIAGTHELGTRCEIKNLNSFRFIADAVIYEAKRQIELLENGQTINQETRLYDTSTGETRCMRSKEDATDYRYFPDPDLRPIRLTDEYITEVQNEIVELPHNKKLRYISEHGLSAYDAEILVSDAHIANFFDEIVTKISPKLAVNWINGELLALMNKHSVSFENLKISANHMIKLLQMIENKKISGSAGKIVIADMFETGENPQKIVESKNLGLISDSTILEPIIDKILANNIKKVEEYKSGKDKLFGFFVGQVMKETQGSADPGMINSILKDKLS